jgi:hypothetical protein
VTPIAELIEAALDQPDPTPALQRALDRAMVAAQHPLAPTNRSRFAEETVEDLEHCPGCGKEWPWDGRTEQSRYCAECRLAI